MSRDAESESIERSLDPEHTHQCQVPTVGNCKHGQIFACPGCERTYVHICNEVEGCFWLSEADFR